MSRDGLALHAVGQTDIGLKRKRNEDFHQFAIPSPGSLQERRGALFIVADGMGAMGGGDVASRTAVTEILRHFYDPSCIEQESFNCLKDALELANGAVRDQAQQVNLPRIGTTAAGLAVLPSGDALVFNVGDSRVYRVRQGLIEQLSHDQSVLQNQLDAGHITPEQARGARNVNVTAFIGQPTPLSAVYRRVQVQSGDSFLLCSDGLWDLVEPREVLNIMQRYTPAVAAQKLINLARKRGGPDNITVIIVEAGKVPHSGKKLIAGLAVLGVLILTLVAGGLFLLSRDESGDATATSGSSAALAQTEEATEPPTASPTHQQAILSYMTLTPTPSYTPSITPSPLPATDTPIPTATHTPRPTNTPTARPTTTPTDMPTDTPLPSATPLSPTPTWTPRPTRTQTSIPTVTLTLAPTDTPMRQPTVTLNPTLVTFTPTVPPTATPTLTPAEQNLQFAIEDGVALQANTTLAILPAMGDAQTILLPQGTEVKLLGEETRPNPNNVQDLLRQVRVLNGVHEDKVGWLPQSAIEMADPIVPRIVVKSGLEQGANVRRGDSMSYPVVGMLRSGESAPIIGISSTGSGWYQIELDNGLRGWIAPGVVTVTGRLDRVPSIMPPPSPTPSITPTDTVPTVISTDEATPGT